MTLATDLPHSPLQMFRGVLIVDVGKFERQRQRLLTQLLQKFMRIKPACNEWIDRAHASILELTKSR